MRWLIALFLIASGLAVVPAPRLHGIRIGALPEATAIDPPPGALRAWRELVACTGLPVRRGRGFDAIRWFRVEGTSFVRPDDGRRVIGLWIRSDNAVILAGGRLDDDRLLKHELLHALLQQGGHDARAFARSGRCGFYRG